MGGQSKSQNPVWIELVQLVPVIILALPFIARGEVDLARAASGFLVGAVSFVIVSLLVLQQKGVLNPILVGTGAWLVLGALAFNVPLEALASSLSAARGFSLFVVVSAVGLLATFTWKDGFIGCPSDDRTLVRRQSVVLLAIVVLAAVWAFRFRSDIRLGGGLPFIVSNVARRLLIRRSALSAKIPR
jgi:hypothetical protein